MPELPEPSSFDLIVLGAGPAWSDRPGSSGAAYLVRTARTAVLLDLGQGSFPRLIAEIPPERLDAVVISHLHPDHFIDLVPLRHYLAFQLGEVRRVRVIAPDGLTTRIDALHDRPGFTAHALDVEPPPTDVLRVGDLRLEMRRVTHTDDSHAMRVSGADGRGLVYSGDCGVAADLAPLVQPGDTLLVEVSFGAGAIEPGTPHLNAQAIADLVRVVRPGRVLLTHIQMGLDEAAPVRIVQAAMDGPVELVRPGDRFRID